MTEQLEPANVANTTTQSQVVGSVPGLRTAIAQFLDEVDIVSFDIFDTLVERRIGPPEQIKRLAARIAASAAAQEGLSLSADRLLGLRYEVEAGLRSRAAASGLDHECRFSELAGELATRLLADSGAPLSHGAMQQLLIDAELSAEGQALLPKPGMVELVAELRRGDRRVIAVSDMYLDGTFLTILLQRLGFDFTSGDVYVSADAGLGKYSGRLFDHMLRQERLAPSRLLHVGDNPHSDHRIPLSMGARSILLHERTLAERAHLNQAHKWLADRNRYWRGPHATAEIPPSADGDFFTRFGHDVLGPIFSIFSARIREILAEEKFDRVFFLAREGELLMQIHELFESAGQPDTPRLPHGYLYVSRKAVLLPSTYKGMAKDRLRLLSHQTARRGLAGVAGALGIDPAAFAAVAESLGLRDVYQSLDLDKEDWPQRLAENLEFQDTIRHHAVSARAILRRYLEQEGFFGTGRKVALVDIGWNGSIQRALRDAFGSDDDWPDVRGLYVSFNDNLGHGLGENEAHGILFDRRSTHPRHDILAHFEELFENSARALHASTVGYEELADGRVAPVFREESAQDRQAERQFNATTEALRRGVLAYAGEFARCHALYGYSAADMVPFALSVAHRHVFYPTREEAEHLFRMVHAEDAGTDSVLTFADYQLRGPSMLLRPFRLLTAIQKSHWKYGTGRSLGLPGFNHLLRLAHRALILRSLAKASRPISDYVLHPSARWWEHLLLWITRHGGLPFLQRINNVIRRAR